jgi:hypothetical protein
MSNPFILIKLYSNALIVAKISFPMMFNNPSILILYLNQFVIHFTWRTKMLHLKPTIYSKAQTANQIREKLVLAPEQKCNSTEAFEGHVMEFILNTDQTNQSVGSLSEFQEYDKTFRFTIHTQSQEIVEVYYSNGKFICIDEDEFTKAEKASTEKFDFVAEQLDRDNKRNFIRQTMDKIDDAKSRGAYNDLSVIAYQLVNKLVEYL